MVADTLITSPTLATATTYRVRFIGMSMPGQHSVSRLNATASWQKDKKRLWNRENKLFEVDTPSSWTSKLQRQADSAVIKFLEKARKLIYSFSHGESLPMQHKLQSQYQAWQRLDKLAQLPQPSQLSLRAHLAAQSLLLLFFKKSKASYKIICSAGYVINTALSHFPPFQRF